jgi:cell division protein FtsI (penicillin-binding protein 3)
VAPDQPANVLRATLKRRVALAFGFLMLWAVAIEARLVYLQVFRYSELKERAEGQHSRTVKAPAKRGDILDRHGHILAYSVDADTIYAVPSELGDAEAAAASLCRALADCDAKDRQAMVERIRKGKYFAYIRRQVWPDQAARVAALEPAGHRFHQESKRTYPNSDLASHVLGYVGVDNVGLSGIEAAYDSLILGRAGTVLVERDARGSAFSRVERPPTAGASLELTIDEYLQHVAERELRDGVKWAGASGGSAIVMDPYTGEILALANAPDFESQRVSRRARRAAPQSCDPGHLRAGIDVQDRHRKRGVRRTEGDAEHDHRRQRRQHPLRHPGDSRRPQLRCVVVSHRRSSSRATSARSKVALDARAGEDERLRAPVRLRQADVARLSVARALASSGIHRSSPTARLASVAMGYQVGVTPLQMAQAVSVVANGGELVQPRVVRAVIRDRRRMPVPRKVIRVRSPPTQRRRSPRSWKAS